MYNKRCYPPVPPQECGLELARPYVNRVYRQVWNQIEEIF